MTSTDSKAGNIKLLYNITALVPNQGIKVSTFERHYPNWQNAPDQQSEFDENVSQLLTWYLASIQQFEAFKEQIDALMKEKDERLREKDAQIREKDAQMGEKDAQMREKDAQMGEKDTQIRDLSERLKWIEMEASDITTALVNVTGKSRPPIQKWGTVTRSQAWNALVEDGHVSDIISLSDQIHAKKSNLISQFGKIDETKWKEEKDMYPGIIEAMQSTFYAGAPGVFVVDTHNKGDFRPDVSVGDYEDDRLPYCLWYFIEFKLPGPNLLSADNCGQVLDYFFKAHEKQPHRRDFIGVLSNFISAWVFTARYEAEAVTISKRSAPSLADAIVYADKQSQLQYKKRIPPLDERFAPDYTILAVARHHFLLQVPLPALDSVEPTSTKPVATSKIQTRNQTKASTENQSWRSPSRHRKPKFLVLKIVHGNTTVANEINILKKIRDVECVHLPELVWAPEGDKQLGIVPVGEPIDFRQPASVSRKVVQGLVDGLDYIHAHGIVHRDIRPSNLVLDRKNNVVIIDYETSVTTADSVGVQYLGGFICWPKRLLESNTTHYTPEPVDDLFACILVVLHLLFPSRFEAFRASSVRVSNKGQQSSSETARLLALWTDIGQSKIWGSFVEAAKERNYERLKDMADVFCHI